MKHLSIGDVFHRWKVIGEPTRLGIHFAYECICECGSKSIVRKFQLEHGLSKSCGCFASEQSSHRNTTHGMTDTPEFNTWTAMLKRCYTPGRKDAKSYFEKGITVCDEWRGENGFINFYKYMGKRSDGMSLDRIDFDGNYEPSNCRWATAKEQGNNKSSNRLVDVNGKMLTLSLASSELGIRQDTLAWRLKHWGSYKKSESGVDKS